MINTRALFELQESLHEETWARADLRLTQALYFKLKAMHLGETLASLMEDGYKPAAQVLSLQYGECTPLDKAGERASEALITSVCRSHFLRPRFDFDGSLQSLASTFDTHVSALAPPHTELLVKRTPLLRDTSAAKVLGNSDNGGVLLMLKALLGQGMGIECQEHELGRCEGGGQVLAVKRREFFAVFTGSRAPICLSVHPKIRRGTLIDRTLREFFILATVPEQEGWARNWGRLSHPYWSNADMTEAIVAHSEEGHSLTHEMSEEMTQRNLARRRIDPGPAEDGSSFEPCGIGSCGGIKGRGGFCRTCSQKMGLTKPCREGKDDHVIVHTLLREGEIAGYTCECGGASWVVQNA
jgi:hypothetical protein